MPPITPVFRVLSRRDSEAVVRAHHYGRLAFAFRDRVDIEPIHYVHDDQWIVARTGEGTKLTVLTHHPWVAFEVDEVQSMFSWRSVVLKGTVYMLDEDAADPTVREHAIEVYRRLLPTAFTDQDPVPNRSVLFRIHIDEWHGRGCSPGSE